MGSHHVPLNIGEDGLVKSVGNQSTDDLYETCVLCGELTDVLKSTHVDFRSNYVEGSGQVCYACNNRTMNIHNFQIENRMRLRRTLIKVPAEDIIDRPNDADLGAHVRQIFWAQEQESLPKSKWVCQYCGEDTSFVDSDYLVDTDHLSCALKAETK
jgi:hypothetical protein